MARLRLTADLDHILASVPVDRVAVRVTYQPREEPEAPPNPFAREEVAAPVVGEGRVTLETSNFRCDKARVRIRELEQQLQRRTLPKAERRLLRAEHHALSTAIEEWRGRPLQSKSRARTVGMGYVR